MPRLNTSKGTEEVTVVPKDGSVLTVTLKGIHSGHLTSCGLNVVGLTQATPEDTSCCRFIACLKST